MDDIDRLDIEVHNENETTKIAASHASNFISKHNVSYWDSLEAQYLFCPKNNETVQECLNLRDVILKSASFDDESLVNIITDADVFENGSEIQKRRLRVRCLYLHKAYECALQYMNKKLGSNVLI